MDITGKAWQALHNDARPFFVIGDAMLFRKRCRDLPIVLISTPEEADEPFHDALPILHRPFAVESIPGKLDSRNAPQVIAAIREAADFVLAGQAAAMVTNPIQKETLYSAGFKHQGHTDFLGALARERGFAATDVMMLAAGDFRVVPVTVHIPLKDVARTLTSAMIVAQAEVVSRDLTRYFGIAKPRIALTGLNPHAGEGGMLGTEDDTVIKPAIAALRAADHQVTGPLPADTAFHAEARASYDAILCMYHDQALIPVKMLDFFGGVNITLGLPFIRTSPDHGTALALAGTGQARADSLIKAIQIAGQMADAGA